MAKRIPTENERAVKDLRAQYARAADDVLRILEGLQPIGFNASKSAAARARVNAVIVRLNRYARSWTKRRIREAYAEGRDVAEARLSIMGEFPLTRRVNANRHKKTERRLADRVFADLFKANRSIEVIARRYCNAMLQSAEGVRELQAFDEGLAERFISRVSAAAVKTGLARGDLQKRLLKYLQNKLSGQDFITINGRNFNLRDYSELVARTNLRNAQTEAIKTAAWEYNHDLVEIPYKDGSCDECQEFEGKVYSLSGDDPEFPMLEEQPPLHPRCRHYLRVTSRNILRQGRAA